MVLLSATKKCRFQSLAGEYYLSPTVLDKIHHHWHTALAPHVQLGIPKAILVRRARKHACWLPQEHTWVYPLHIPSRITFLNCFPATETWDQALLVQRCLPPCQMLQETQQWQIPTFPENKPSKKRAVPVSCGQLFGELIDTCIETIKRMKGDL